MTSDRSIERGLLSNDKDASGNNKSSRCVQPRGRNPDEMNRDRNAAKLLLVVLAGTSLFLMAGGVSDFVHISDIPPFPGSFVEFDASRFARARASTTKRAELDQACEKDPECEDLPTDNLLHPWHWARAERGYPDRASSTREDCKGDSYGDLYEIFHTKGYVVFESCSPLNVNGQDPETIEFLEYLHGGVQTNVMEPSSLMDGHRRFLHSEAMFADTFPRSRMTSIWVAKQDMAGSIPVISSSHYAGVLDFAARGKYEAPRLKSVEYIPGLKQGQTLVWAAPTLHGRTTNNMDQSSLAAFNYYFEGAENYWSPIYSKLDDGKVFFKIRPIDSTHVDDQIFPGVYN